MLVADSSLVIELSLDRLGTQALGEEQLISPCLLWSEVPSVLSEMAFRGDISRRLAEQALGRFVDGKIKVTEHRPKGLSRRHGRSRPNSAGRKPTTPSTWRRRAYSAAAW